MTKIQQKKNYQVLALDGAKKVVSGICDNGFINLQDILRKLQRKAGDMYAGKIKYISVYCYDENSYRLYVRTGSKMKIDAEKI